MNEIPIWQTFKILKVHVATLEMLIENVVLLTQKSRSSWRVWIWGKQRMKPQSLPHICVMSPQLFVWWKPHSQLTYISYKRKRWQRILWVDSQQKLSIKSSKHDIGSLCLLNIQSQVVIVKLAPKFYKVSKWGVKFKFAFRFDMNWVVLPIAKWYLETILLLFLLSLWALEFLVWMYFVRGGEPSV